MGFWDFLYRSRPVNDSSRNKVIIPGMTDSRDVNDAPDFTEEFATEFDNAPEIQTDNSYSKNGVSVKETANVFRLAYDGILARDGAQDVYAVVGSGDNKYWQDVKYYQMLKAAGQGYELVFPVRGTENLNIAFKDGADHWDNNSGKNYTYANRGG